MSSEAITRNDLKNILNEVLPVADDSPKIDTLYSASSGIATTTYALSGNLNDYDLVHITAISSYGNNWEMTMPTKEVLANPNVGYFTSLGTEFAVYHLSIKFPNASSVNVAEKGSGTVGMRIVGIKL